MVVPGLGELVEIELLVDEDPPGVLVEVVTPVKLVVPPIDDVEIDKLVDVIPPTVVVEAETLELERVLNEVDVPPFELVEGVLVTSPVLEVGNDVVDVGGFMEPVEVCCALLVVVVGGGLAEVDVVWEPPAVVVVPSEGVAVLVVGARGEAVVVSEALLVLVLLMTGGVVLELGDKLDELREDVTVPELVVAEITTEVVLDPLMVAGDVG